MRTAAARLGIACAALACSGGGWLPADIQRSETLSALGASGYARLCSAFEDYVRDEYRSSYLIQAVCVAYGIQTTSSAQACGDTASVCVNTLPPPAESTLNAILRQASCDTIAVEPAGCAATVAELTACLDALSDKVENIKLTATCAVAGEPLADTWWRLSLPAQCQAIRSRCPVTP